MTNILPNVNTKFGNWKCLRNVRSLYSNSAHVELKCNPIQLRKSTAFDISRVGLVSSRDSFTIASQSKNRSKHFKYFPSASLQYSEVAMGFSLKNRNTNETPNTRQKRLLALDFDHTVVDDNTDIVARDLVSAETIPSTVKDLYKASGWIPYMQEIFHILYANGFRKADLLTAVEAIPEVAGFTDLIRTLHTEHNFDVIIVSDSNSEFIGAWNQRHSIDQYIRSVFTNPARFDKEGRLLINPFHHQTACALSSENLCKGAVLESFVRAAREDDESPTEYETIFYVGDGRNDICPVLRLGKQDFGCARKNFRMEMDIHEVVDDANGEAGDSHRLDATMVYWNDGVDLLNMILRRI